MLPNLEFLLQNIPEALLILNIDGCITYANPAASALTGYTHSELINQPFDRLYPNANDFIRTEYELSQARKNGKLIVEGWRLKKDRTPFWAEVTLAPMFDEQQTLMSYSCLLRDTSDKKQRDVALRENEERFRLMVQGVREYAIFLLDVNGYITTWNEGAERTKGYRSHEIIGKHFSTFYTHEDLESRKPERELKIAIATGKYEEEGWRVKKNGSVFWANVVITALFNDQNKHIGFSKVTRDLTERKQAQEVIRQSEERYRSLVEQVTDYGIFMLDDKGRIISWNEGARRIKGYSAEEIIGKYFSIFYTQEDLLNNKPANELRIAKDVGKYEEEGWRLRKDGSLFWANIVITAVYNSDGTLIGFSKVTRDLSERKAAERALHDSYKQQRILAEKLKATNDELAAINEELAVTNDDLAETNRLLMRSNQSLQQFAYVASHDLQEPLRKIMSFSTLLQEQFAEQLGEGTDYLERMQSAASRMSTLIRDLLAFSRLTTRRDMAGPIALTDVVNQVLTDIDLTIQEAVATVTVGPLPIVYGDSSQMRQLFQNLISNALKFRRAEVAPVIQVSAHELASADLPISIKPSRSAVAYHRIEVADNGIGFEEKYTERIFEVFQRLHGRSEYAGTGIGLAICEKVALNHGGAITAVSKPGQGSTFIVYLPVETQPISALQAD
ncbi:PAS domain S-box protein [Larkinella insperata]|uniref:histidine kinase n=1 Tax=Larkinella insperata TaxID=332158 RepID=A0ABW3Q4U5_9BACT|nr:PAS domain-containing sensor histidine kinase [Larkinella insperata]